MRCSLTLLAILSLGTAWQAALADEPIRLRTWPAVSTADGRSTISITADIRDADGRPVPDGTRVAFETSLGSFRESVVTTTGGLAVAVLVASSTPGTAVIKASSAYVGSAAATLNYTFLASRDELKAYQDYIEISSTNTLTYTPRIQTYLANGANGGVHLRYRNVRITADELQMDLSDAGRFQVRARNALLKIGSKEKQFEQIYYVLNTKTGVGIGSYLTRSPQMVSAMGSGLEFIAPDRKGDWGIAPLVERFGTVDIKGDQFVASNVPIGSTDFEFIDVDQGQNYVAAKKIFVIPGREVQFQRAAIYVQGVKTIRLPLFDLKTSDTANNLATANALTVSDNQVELNYPQYLSLRPGMASILRFRTGQQDTADGVHRGMFLDYELSWDHADEMNGGVTMTGLSRSDWALGLRQQLRVNDRNSMSFDLNTPRGDGFIGQAGIESLQNGYSMHASADSTRTFDGIDYSEKSYQAGVDLKPISLGRIPFSITPGISASRSESSLIPVVQEGYGLQLQGTSSAIHIDRRTLLSSGFTVGHYMGRNEVSGLAYGANLFVSHTLARTASVHVGYSYSKQGFTDLIYGSQVASAGGNATFGNASVFLEGQKSIDVQGDDLSARFAYRASKMWHFTSTYSVQRVLSDSFLDYGVGFTYRLGFAGIAKDVGLLYNYRTHGVGFQIFDPTNF